MLGLRQQGKYLSRCNMLRSLLNAPCATDRQQGEESADIEKGDDEFASLAGIDPRALRSLDLPNVEDPVVHRTEVVVWTITSLEGSLATTVLSAHNRDARKNPDRLVASWFKYILELEDRHL